MSEYDEEYLKAIGGIEEVDDTPLEQFDPSEIDFMEFNPYAIDNFDEAVLILQYLKKSDMGRQESYAYAVLCSEFELEAVTDPWKDMDKNMKILIASDFLRFCQYAFMCEKGFKFKLNWHHTFMARTFEMMYRGELPHKNLIINVPPRYSKTQMAIYFTAWSMGMSPDAENIHVTYSGELAESNGGQVLECIDSEWYREIFNVIINNNYRKRKDWKTTKSGRLFATSTGGKLTGVGAGKMRKTWGGYIWIDDPHKAEDVKSTVKMQAATSWFSNTCLSRRNEGDGGFVPILIIMQRLSEEDLTYYCLPSDEEPEGHTPESFTHFNIPALLTREELDAMQEAVFHVDKKFNIYETDTFLKGDAIEDEFPLWPQKHSLEELRRMKKRMPILTFYGQYQQRPYVDAGIYFKREWFEIVNQIDYSQVKTRVFVLDTALTEKKTSDYSVILVACIMKNGQVIVEDMIRGKWTSPNLLKHLSIAYMRYGPSKVYIEYKTSGITLCQLIKHGNMQGTIPPMPVKKIPRDGVTGNDKITRAENSAPFMENGAVKILKADWNSKLILEAVGFPTVKHDDIIDTIMDLVEREIAIHGMYDMDLSQVEKELEKPKDNKSPDKSSKSKDWRDFYNQGDKQFAKEEEITGWGSLAI